MDGESEPSKGSRAMYAAERQSSLFRDEDCLFIDIQDKLIPCSKE
jgi:hypothetical protein